MARALSEPLIARFEALPAAGAIAIGVFAGTDILGAARAVPHAGCLCQIELPADAAQGALDYQAFIRANHPNQRHWFVGPVGVEPGRQGAGIGTEAMRALMNSIVGAGLVCVEAEDHIRLRSSSASGSARPFERRRPMGRRSRSSRPTSRSPVRCSVWH